MLQENSPAALMILHPMITSYVSEIASCLAKYTLPRTFVLPTSKSTSADPIIDSICPAAPLTLSLSSGSISKIPNEAIFVSGITLSEAPVSHNTLVATPLILAITLVW
uniref:Uncharacterized protein n=1 Tax=Panagrolaimus superbus TaxID=310955 RepID=A0A914YA95_9BILA